MKSVQVDDEVECFPLGPTLFYCTAHFQSQVLKRTDVSRHAQYQDINITTIQKSITCSSFKANDCLMAMPLVGGQKISTVRLDR